MRLFHTIRHMKPSQIAARISIRLRKRLCNWDKYCVNHYQTAPPLQPVPAPVDFGKLQLVPAPRGRTFTFLNHTADIGDSWFPQNVSQLWRYNLHYFAWIHSRDFTTKRCTDGSTSGTLSLPKCSPRRLAEVGTKDTEREHGDELRPNATSELHPSSHPPIHPLLTHWLDNVPPGPNDAWHPYTTSLRICNWIWWYSRVLNSLAIHPSTHPLPDFLLRLCNSLHNQVRLVSNFMEFDVLGNHLIENCKALVVAGVFLGESKWVDKGLRVLLNQLKEQVLPDGGHYERSPMYHCIVLEDLLAVRKALEAGKHPVPEQLQTAISAMAHFLEQVIEPDGTIPHFNDSADGIAALPGILLTECTARLRSAVPWQVEGNNLREDANEKIPEKDNPSSHPPIYPSTHHKISPLTSTADFDRACPELDEGLSVTAQCDSSMRNFGLFVKRSPALSLTFDCGKLCPDFLPAHAHNDMLSYTLWMNGEWIVTDSGVYEYQAGKWRDFFRSTAAHSTIMINGEEQNDTWASFRVARRGYPHSFEAADDGSRVQGGTTCYRHRGVDILRRIEFLPDSAGIVVADTITSKIPVNFDSFVQLAPGVEIGPEKSSHSFRELPLRTSKNSNLVFLGPSELGLAIEEGWESREFGLKMASKRLRMSRNRLKGKSSYSYAIVTGNTLQRTLKHLDPRAVDQF